MKNFSLKIGCVLALSSLVFLPGCDWLKEKLGLNKAGGQSVLVDASKGGGAVLATMNGKPLITADEFEKQYKNLIETHPYGAMLAQMEGLEKRFCEGLVSQKAMTRCVVEEGITETPEYKQQLEALIQMLNTRFFQMKHQPKVTDAEIREFFEQNKTTMPEAMMSRGGVNATGVSFAKEADAKAFLEKAKGKGAMLEKVAKDATVGDKFRDFKLVNVSSIGVDPVLRDKIVALAKLPALELIKGGDNNFYVVYAASKEEPKYRNFEELKGTIEQRLMGKKQEEALEKAVAELKTKYNIQINEEYFDKKAKGPKEDIINEEQLEMVMPEAAAQEAAQVRATPPAKAA